MSIRHGLASRLAHLSLASSALAMRVVPGREMLPSRPAPSQAQPSFGTASSPAVLHAANLIDCARVGGAVVSPDGSLACFAVRQYSWDEKKFDNQLWIADLATAASLTDEERQQGQSPPSAGPHLAWRPAASSGWPPSSSGEPPSQSPISAYFGHPGAGCARPPYAAHRGVAARLQQRV